MSRIIEATDPFIFQTIKYPAGEHQVRVRPESMELVQDVTALCIRGGDADTIMQGLMAYDAITGGCSASIVGLDPGIALVFPYLPYSRADRKFTQGDCFGLRTFLDLLPAARTFTLDVHGKVPPGYGVINVPADSIMLNAYNYVYTLTGVAPVVLLPDAGARNRYAHIFPLGTVYNAQKRRDGATGQLSGFDVPTLPAGRPVLIVDDICDGGGTFLGIASELGPLSGGVTLDGNSLHLHVTHGVFSNRAVDRLHAAGFVTVTATDSLREPADCDPPDRVFPALPVIQAFMEAHS